MALNRTTFFAYVRRAPFGNRLAQEQVDGMTCIIDAWAGKELSDLRWLAYILATAFHETGGRMVPVREGFAKSDAKARKIVASRSYGAPDGKTGEVYYGRGYVQLTWSKNYIRMGSLLDCDLYNNPDLALDPKLSADIIIEGMTKGRSVKGDFTGHSLDEYFNDTTDDPVEARRIVNGTDKAQLIATYHAAFLSALQAADTATPQPTDVKPEAAEADAPSLLKDKTVWGALSSVGAAGGAGLLSAIDSPYALIAVLFVGVCVILFLTGRLELRHKKGA